MIEWLSDHIETAPSGKVLSVKIGKGSEDFWRDYEIDTPTWAARGITEVRTSNGRYVKYYQGDMQYPPALDFPIPIPPLFLRDFQRKHFLNLWDIFTKNTSVGDFSDTGTGKTYVTVALALLLKRPLFVVCLMAGIDKWKNVIIEYGAKAICVGNYEYFKGDNEFGTMQAEYYPYEIFSRVLSKPGKPVFCPFPKNKKFSHYNDCLKFLFSRTHLRLKHLDNWELEHGKKLRLLSREITGYEWALPKNALIVFDEVHKCKSEDSQNMRLLVASKPWTSILLSATPGVTPRDFCALGYALGLHNLYDFDLWTENHGCQKVFTEGGNQKFIGWKYSKKSHGLESLSNELYPAHAARMRISEIPSFPKTVITAECFTAKEAPQINNLYLKLVEQCKEAISTNRMLPVTAVLRYRQAIELFKVRLFLELIEEANDNGFSVAMFVNFTETLEHISKKLPGVPVIMGGQKKVEREKGRLAFERNQVKNILLNGEAGGTSLDLHDIYGLHPRMTLISPTYNPYTLKQIFGRVNRDGGKSTSFQRIVYMAGTQEEKVCEKVKIKMKAFDTVNGDITSEDLIEDILLNTTNLNELENLTPLIEGIE
jgi:superfamily II DNA or RNA helicase